MDGISGAAAVIGLVQATTQVTTALGRYVSRVKEAESSRAKLLDQIRLISAAEKAIEKAVQSPSRLPRTLELQALIDEWFKDDGPPTKCRAELEELSSWLESQAENNKYKRWAKRIAWPAKEDKIQATIRAFERYMPYFYGILSLETINVFKSMETRYMNSESAATKSELLLWLYGFDCTNKHESTLRQRQQTTGNWFFKEQLYVDWRRGSTKFIWLHGKAGAGKSVLASAVIDDLSNGLADNETLAYFYFDFRNIRCSSAMEVLRSVTKQLLWNSQKDWLSSFSDLTSRKARGAGPPTDLGTLLDLLQRAAELHERPIVVVDALDECEDLSNLLDELTKLAHGHCRVFVTSRTLHTIKEAFIDLSAIPLDDRVDEIRDDMHLHIKTELGLRSRLKILTQELKDEIQGVLMKKAGGMFRWVQCQLDRLNECYSLGDVREVLDTLPATLYETYDQMLRAIDKKPFGPLRARRALTWLVTVLIPLTLSELAEAMSISCDKPEWDSVSAPMHETDILDILGSLVTVNDHEITLSHYSVKEYLTSNTFAHSTYFVHRSGASLELATVSIFSLVLLSDISEICVEDWKNLLYRYADYCGLQHLADCHPDHNASLVKHLLTLQNRISIHRLIYKRCLSYNEWMLETRQLALYIIIRFGHPALLRHYLDCHPVQATEEDNPLVFAALYSDIPRVQFLLGKGLDVNHHGLVHTHHNTHKMTPLTAAARNYRPENQEGLVKLLLQNGCLVSRDAIHSVFSRNLGVPRKLSVVRILLEHGADPQWLGAGRSSCLHLALAPRVSYDDDDDDECEIAQALVTAGCDPTALDDRGQSSFQLAIRSLSTEFVRMLLRCGFQLPPDAIICAVLSFHSDYDRKILPMLEFLLANGAIAGAQDVYGRNALHHFSLGVYDFNGESMESVVRFLVEHGCDINGYDDRGATPLHLAAAYPAFNLDILNLFIAQGAELPVDIVNYAVQRFQYTPRPRHAIAILTSLVKEFGASCRSQTIGGDNALHCLLKCYWERKPEDISDVISFLVENGCDVHAPAPSGETPLQLAIENNWFSVSRSILAQITEPYFIDHTKPYHGDSEGNGILHRLCGRRNNQLEDKVKLLLEAGYDFARDINRPNKQGFTPLCITLMRCRATDVPAMVSCLLDLGATFRHVKYLYLEHLEWASDLPWYRDAVHAHGRYLSRSNTTFDHVILVRHLLRVAHQGRLSSVVARSILNIAEYWACMRVTRNDIRYTTAYGSEQFPFPIVPGNAECWVPRRLVFSCKVGTFVPRTRDIHAAIQVRIERPGALFTVPIDLRADCDVLDPPRASFDVWDEFTPAVQMNGMQRLMVTELIPGDMLSIELHLTNDHFTLEFFQIEVYYSMKPLSTRATSGDL